MSSKEIREKIDELHAEYMGLPLDTTTDERFDELEAEIRYHESLLNKATDSEYNETIPKIKNPNDFVKQFLNSFEDCVSKTISKKQADVFANCLRFAEQENGHSSFYGNSFVIGSKYHGSYNGMIFEVSIYQNVSYLTKRSV